jgi:hypothetical protein
MENEAVNSEQLQSAHAPELIGAGFVLLGLFLVDTFAVKRIKSQFSLCKGF